MLRRYLCVAWKSKKKIYRPLFSIVETSLVFRNWKREGAYNFFENESKKISKFVFHLFRIEKSKFFLIGVNDKDIKLRQSLIPELIFFLNLHIFSMN